MRVCVRDGERTRAEELRGSVTKGKSKCLKYAKRELSTKELET